ncbi:uracil-DNA glycosylase [Eubacterium sp. AB3007]|uniref:uracil-DNA glycosylase n=1 Tax=Eubacterium sp. AB3007 TaxID=1392487 RepID=UPI0004840B61|nr:uracil-DNA glycosylase [Eubacterium sp. AB3007]
MVNIGNDWDQVLTEEFQKEYYQQLRQFLVEEYRTHVVYPDMHDIFNALKATAYQDVKVVILGQDPYHEPGQAHGMSFSVKPGVPQPPSLVNIFRELESDLGIAPPPKDYGYLMHWAQEGVLLLNTVLTVREHAANSHKGKGWEQLTDRIISALNEREAPVVFLLWGKNAQAKVPLITAPQHLILTGAHPSPLSAHHGFFGGRYFTKANAFLKGTGQGPVDWTIKEVV